LDGSLGKAFIVDRKSKKQNKYTMSIMSSMPASLWMTGSKTREIWRNSKTSRNAVERRCMEENNVDE